VADILTKLLFIILARSRRSGEVLSDWGKADVPPIFSKGQKDILRSNGTVTLMLGKLWSVLSWSTFLEAGGWEQSAWINQG